ncbi:hypothetical protein CHARACLAT_029230 [Characodon lateralis]|uniref:C2H2-type domain-containing protein n=1 Tax=Characodon lateralis TaxID=208331 RepID=A0ABU7EYC0_9TELE|nr:hypothetical protein [Characodon lateralis]
MADLAAVRSQVALIVSSLAQMLLTGVGTAAGELSNNPESQAEEKLGAAADRLCLEAVDKILKILKANMTRQEETVREAPPSPDDTCGKLMKTQTGEGEDAGVHDPSTDHTYILLYRSTAGESRSLLVALQSTNSADGENKTSSSDSMVEKTQLHPRFSSPSSPTNDHAYAQPSAPPPDAASAAEVRVRTKHCSWRRQKTVKVSVETHLQCSRCSKLFPSAERLADHEKKSHPLCSVCGTMFTGILKLREHEIKEHGLLPYGCNYCPKRFNHKTHRDLHVKAHHTREKCCHCDICGKGYSCISVLKTHRMTHFNKTFVCEVCGKAFYHTSHLTRHKLVHQEVRPYSCSTCGKGFTQAANLRSHQATHTRERQLCFVCGKNFRCLRNHIISKHSHELPASALPAADAIINCEMCGKKFPNPSQYKAHQRSHTGEKPFHCDVCGKSYRLKELLRDHRYTHTGQKPYKCSLCSKTFNQATSFMRHCSIHSGDTPYSCHDCGKHFRLLTFLKAHLQTRAHLKRSQQNRNATTDL